MQASVLKYPLAYPDEGWSWVRVPERAELLSLVCEPDDRLVVYALVHFSVDRPVEERRSVVLANTGDLVNFGPNVGRFLGTVRTSGGIVWHGWEARRV